VTRKLSVFVRFRAPLHAVKRVNPKMKVGVFRLHGRAIEGQFLEEEKIVDLVVGQM
jgi:hypothetical protein